MDNRFLQWLAVGLFVIIVAAFVAAQIRGERISGITISSCTALIGIGIGAATANRRNNKDDSDGESK